MAIVIIGVSRDSRVRDCVDAINVVYVAILVVVNTIAFNLPGVFPHVCFKIVVCVPDSRINNSYCNFIRTSRDIPSIFEICINCRRITISLIISQPPKFSVCIGRIGGSRV